MRIVKEHISFKRGLDTRSALNIGEYKKIYNPTYKQFSELKDGYYIINKNLRRPANTLVIQVLTTTEEKLYIFGSLWAESMDLAIKSFEDETYKGDIDHFWTAPGEETEILQKIEDPYKN